MTNITPRIEPERPLISVHAALWFGPQWVRTNDQGPTPNNLLLAEKSHNSQGILQISYIPEHQCMHMYSDVARSVRHVVAIHTAHTGRWCLLSAAQTPGSPTRLLDGPVRNQLSQGGGHTFHYSACMIFWHTGHRGSLWENRRCFHLAVAIERLDTLCKMMENIHILSLYHCATKIVLEYNVQDL